MSKNYVTSVGALTDDTARAINSAIGDTSRCTTQFDAVTGTTGATLTNVVGLVTDTLLPGTYKYEITLGTVATANSGLKLGLKQGTASMLTSIEYQAVGFTASGLVCSRGTTATDAATILGSTTAIIRAVVTGTVVVALPGTLQLQAAQNAAHADTTSVFVGSTMTFEKIN